MKIIRDILISIILFLMSIILYPLGFIANMICSVIDLFTLNKLNIHKRMSKLIHRHIDMETCNDDLITKVADYIVKTGTNATSNGSWIIYYDELLSEFSDITEAWLRNNHNTIIKELEGREEVAEEVWSSLDDNGLTNGFDCNFWLDYCPNAE